MEYSKTINEKRYYWHGWVSNESLALESKERLQLKGDIVVIEKGVGKYPDSTVIGWNIWRRKSEI